jgi:DNA-binding beta-propeller fold protein YncE
MTFRANPSTGAMTPVGLVQTGVAPVSLEVDPSGTWLFVAHSSRDGVAMYAIDHRTGQLALADRRGAYTIDHTTGKLVLRQTVRDTRGAPSTHQGAAVVNPVGGPLYAV